MTNRSFEFTVDTHLFRELGEFLVGRESTALVELIKNAYDADATHVKVHGQSLFTSSGSITVTDNGIGMTPEIFRTSFLRIASRHKEQGERVSPRYRRRYTGAKGVGRLSAHKLAERLMLRSVPGAELTAPGLALGVSATIDWQSMEEKHQTLDDIGDGLRVKTFPVTHDLEGGTELQLDSLRTHWTSAKVKTFVDQVASCLPPSQIIAPPPGDLDEPSLLGEITPWTRNAGDPGFSLELSGDLETGDDFWREFVSRAHWLLEIDALGETVEFGIYPLLARNNSTARSYRLARPHPEPEHGPFFVSRVYFREGTWGFSRKQESATRKYTGIRVYQEGFRVVPYGESRNDWLGLDQDYVRRTRQFEDLDFGHDAGLPPVDEEAFRMTGNSQYVGGVFLTAVGAASLQPVVNREGYLQNEPFETLRDLVRNGVDLLTRAKSAAASRSKDHIDSGPEEESIVEVVQPRQDAAIATEAQRRARRSPAMLGASLQQARQELNALSASIRDDPQVARSVDLASAALDEMQRTVDEVMADHALLQVLASVGLQFAAFIHEVNGLLGQAQSVRELAGFLNTEVMTRPQRALHRELLDAADILCQSLARQASYLTEVVGPDARRRRRRIPLAEAPKASLALLQNAIEDRKIRLESVLPSQLKTPPIFPAELTIIFTNLLTNAVKAAGAGGTILLKGETDQTRGVVFRIENTGTPVDLTDAERWFSPFESTTTEVDIVLGQGLGLGLPITRRVVAEYGGTLQFVAPTEGYATAIEVVLPLSRGS